MLTRDVVAIALNSAGVLLCASAICLGATLFRGSDTEDDVKISDIELGTVMQRQSYSARTVINNHSLRDLQITDVRAGCGCTDVKIQSKAVPAFGNTELHCNIQTGRMVGRVSKPITVIWKHAGGDHYSHSVVNVNMTVQPDYTVDPTSIEVFGNRPSEHYITVHFHEPFLKKRVVAATTSDAAFSTRIIQSAADVTKIQVAFDPHVLQAPKSKRSAILLRLEGVAEETVVVPLTVNDLLPARKAGNPDSRACTQSALHVN